MSSRPRPTTVRPMTAPLRKAILRPALRLRMVALAVRALAYVAVFMPTKPARPLKKPPVRKANGTQGFCTLSTYAIRANIRARAMKT